MALLIGLANAKKPQNLAIFHASFLRGKPTNSEFIAIIADKMRLDKKTRRSA